MNVTEKVRTVMVKIKSFKNKPDQPAIQSNSDFAYNELQAESVRYRVDM